MEKDVDKDNIPPGIPEDATEATEGQQELQQKLEHTQDDPHAPARNQTHRQIPDES